MSEINFRIVARVIGILLCFEALFMLLPDYALHLFLKDIASKWVKERGS